MYRYQNKKSLVSDSLDKSRNKRHHIKSITFIYIYLPSGNIAPTRTAHFSTQSNNKQPLHLDSPKITPTDSTSSGPRRAFRALKITVNKQSPNLFIPPHVCISLSLHHRLKINRLYIFTTREETPLSLSLRTSERASYAHVHTRSLEYLCPRGEQLGTFLNAD